MDRKPRRRTWPVFGWATAAATLLFILVFAGDVFLVTPSVRMEPADIVAQAPQIPAATLDGREAVPLSDAARVAPPTGQTVAEPVAAEKEIVVSFL